MRTRATPSPHPIRIVPRRRVRPFSSSVLSVILIDIQGITEADVRLKLAEEDSQALERGTLPLHEVTPAAMVIELLEIEDIQYVSRYS